MVVASTNAFATNWFVAPTGSGDIGSQAAPFGSIQTAFNKAEPGDTIFLRAGRYHESTVVTAGKSGSAGSPITLTNFEDEKVIIDGSQSLADLGGISWQTLPENNNIFKTTINKDIWQLWVDNKMAIVARWPNVTVGHPTDDIQLQTDAVTPVANTWWDINGTWGHMVNEWNYDSEKNEGTVENNTFYHDLENYPGSFTGGSIILNYHSETQFSRKIVNHDKGSNKIIHEGVNDPHDKSKGHFLVEAKGALDMPGEWYYDKDTSEVWLWPEDGESPSGKDIRGKTQSYAIDFSGSDFLTIKGLQFFGTTIKCIKDFECDNIVLEDNQFYYPSWFRRMLGEHYIPAGSAGGGTEEGATILKGSNYRIENNKWAYSDGYIDMLKAQGSGNLAPLANNKIINNLFHHWSFTGMAQMVLMMNVNSGDSYQTRNTFHTNGSKVMSKVGGVDVNWSRAYHFGYFQQDGVAWQAAGGFGAEIEAGTREISGSWGVERHHLWVHDALKPAVRWDGHDGYHGTDHHEVSMNTPGHGMIKGDKHQLYNNTAVLGQDPNNTMFKVLADNEAKGADLAERNAGTRTINNISDSISGDRHGHLTLTGTDENNWNGYLHTDYGDTAAAQLRDPFNFDFRPRAGSDLIDSGQNLSSSVIKDKQVISAERYVDITAGYLGDKPDIGAYEYGDDHYWIPGYQSKDTALSPVPRLATTSARPDADLMWLAARDAIGHKIYFGTNPAALEEKDYRTDPQLNIFNPGALTPNQQYFWRIDTELANGEFVASQVWNFTVKEPLKVLNENFDVLADVYVDSSEPNKVFEGSSALKLRTPPAQESDQTEQVAYLKFNVTPSAGNIIKATLWLYRDNGGSSINGIEVYSISDTQWSADTLTYNTRPDIDGEFLDSNDIGPDSWSGFNVTSHISNGMIAVALRRQEHKSNRDLASSEAGFSPYLVIEIEQEDPNAPPKPPSGVAATTGGGTVTLSWDNELNEKVVGYNVYRRENIEDFFVTPLNEGLLTVAFFEDTNVQADTPHQYVVKAVDVNGRKSFDSLIVEGSATGIIGPTEPEPTEPEPTEPEPTEPEPTEPEPTEPEPTEPGPTEPGPTEPEPTEPEPTEPEPTEPEPTEPEPTEPGPTEPEQTEPDENTETSGGAMGGWLLLAILSIRRYTRKICKVSR